MKPCTRSLVRRYFFSLYFSFVIFTGFGDNEFFDQNVVETLVATAYLLVSVLLQAYILGKFAAMSSWAGWVRCWKLCQVMPNKCCVGQD